MKIELYGDGIGAVELLQHMGDDRTVVNAARVSFGKEVEVFTERDEKLVRYLWNNKHTSPFEHCMMTFRFTVPLDVRSQHHRHRTWSYNEISRRYTSENIQFYVPPKIRRQHQNDRQASVENSVFDNEDQIIDVLRQKYNADFEKYNWLLDQGVAREQAREVLPMAMYTQYWGTVSLLNAFRFIQLRSTKHAQWEIRQVSNAMFKIIKNIYPVSADAFVKAGVEWLEDDRSEA